MKQSVITMLLLAGCSHQRTTPQQYNEAMLNARISEGFGKDSRLMRGDDAISQSIIDRYCLAESKDWFKADADDKYQSGWRPWLQRPFPQTWNDTQNKDGTYHVRYEASNLDADGKPKDVWNMEMK
jgi:hypothetical protein